jgi:hypothetical protein
MELAGFCEKNQGFSGMGLIFEPEQRQAPRALLSALKESIKELETSSLETPTANTSKDPFFSNVAGRKKEKEVLRYIAIQQWKDEQSERQTNIRRRINAGARVSANKEEQRKKGFELAQSLKPVMQ